MKAKVKVIRSGVRDSATGNSVSDDKSILEDVLLVRGARSEERGARMHEVIAG